MPITDRIRTGPTHEPLRIVLHGVEGVGKTTWAAGAPGAVFVGSEDGAGDLDVARLVVTSWPEVLAAIHDLTTDAHFYRTVVIDTIDFAERLCHQHLTRGSTSLEAVGGGYGKGYKMAAEELAKLLQSLDVLRAKRRMNVIALAHTDVRRYDDPVEAAYDRYQIRMHKEAAGLWMSWADAVLFAAYEVKVRVAAGGTTPEVLKRGKAVDRPLERLLYTERRPAFDAKNRQGLPPELPLSWADFAAAIRWDERDALSRGPAPEGEPLAASAVRDAMAAAAKRGWAKADFLALLGSFSATSGADVRPEHRASVIRALTGAPATREERTE